jgi:signal peptidase II
MRYFRWFVFLVVVLGVTGCDHGTKLLTAKELPLGKSISLITNVVTLEQARNTDTAFSLLAGVIPKQPRLMLLKVTATLGTLVLAIITLLRFGRATNLERTALAFLLGGAAGNMIDRWKWGYVIDFIHVRYWPVFNVADIALCIGGALAAISMWYLSNRAGTPTPLRVRSR